MSIAVNVQNLNVQFHEQPILKNINFSFQTNKITVLVGRSGSGKTTFLRALNRLNEEFIGGQTTGNITIDIGKGLQTSFDDKNKSEITIQLLRHKVGMLFQTPQLLPVSIYRNIAMPLELVGECPKKELKERVSTILKTVGLWDEVQDRLDLPAERLSGGQQQRLCLARTLALEPTILLLDEPTSSLDINATQEIETLLLKLKTQYTIIIVSHNLKQACRLADQLLVFDKGEIRYHTDNVAQTTEKELAEMMAEKQKE